MKKIIIATDTWTPSINGIVTTLKHTKKHLTEIGFDVHIISPDKFKTVPMPTYPEVRISLVARKKMEKLFKEIKPDYIHIAGEASIGLAARMACVKNNWKFTTQYYTDIPQYVQARVKGLNAATYKYMRWFHNASELTIVNTKSILDDLQSRNFKHLVYIPLGADLNLFKKNPNAVTPVGCVKPVFVYFGRIAPEKNLEAFLRCNLPGTKLIIGDGPSRTELEEEYGSSAVFTGYKTGQDLVDLLSISDVFVSPSKTETFGLTTIEAMACGLPVAGYDVQGFADLVTSGVDGFLGQDLAQNALNCLKLKPENCRKKAMEYSIDKWNEKFLANLVPAEFKS